MDQSKSDNFYMQIAKETAQLSYCKRLQVGAIVVKDGNIVSFGFNGNLPGLTNSCEDIEGDTLPTVMHAEANAIAKAARSTVSIDGATLYVTQSPCFDCSKFIIMSGVKRVVYGEEYRIAEPIDILRKCGVEVVKWTGPEA
ncbi:MAG: CMP deaminase [Brevinematales bacterium]|nr:CMP deaminase [Brevinematales bacterium]